MRPNQTKAQKALRFLWRRKEFIIFPIILVLAICTLGAYLLPKKFEASTTILVQREEVMLPMVRMTGDFAMSTDDRFGTFNEITYSRAAIETLIDSLDLGKDIQTADDREMLIKKLRKNIKTEKPGETTYRIIYYAADPLHAQQGNLILARYFISTILQVENKRNEVALDFFQEKLDELHSKYKVHEQEMVALMQNRVHEMPFQYRFLVSNLNEIDRITSEIEKQLSVARQALSLIDQFTMTMLVDSSKGLLLEFQRLEIPISAQVRFVIAKYLELSKKYTPKYPEMVKIRKQLITLLGNVHQGIVQDTVKWTAQNNELAGQRVQIVEQMKQASTTNEIDKDIQSNFDLSRKFYGEMKVKVEQAKMTRDLGSKGSEQFIIIDPPLIPAVPTQPDRLSIILNGCILALLMGLSSGACKELLDPTIQSIQDIGVFHKGIIAFIPEKSTDKT